MKQVFLTLPYPISANRYWRTYMPKGFKAPVTVTSPDAKKYKSDVILLARAAGVRRPITGRVAVDILLYPERPQDWEKRAAKSAEWDNTVRCIDLDNARKVLYDALKNVVFDDDKWIFQDSARRMVPDGKGARVEVTVKELSVEYY